MTTEYGKRLRAARKHANLTQMKLSELTGIPQSSISTAERESKGSADTPVFAKACGIDAHWLATEEGEMLPTPLALLGKPVRALAEVDDSVEGQVHVPLLANAGSMGAGNDLLHDDVLVGHIALSETWVARRLQPTSQNALRFIHAYGDSMSPTFEDGDVLLVAAVGMHHAAVSALIHKLIDIKANPENAHRKTLVVLDNRRDKESSRRESLVISGISDVIEMTRLQRQAGMTTTLQ